MKAPTLAPVIGRIDPSGAGEHLPQMAKMPWYPRDFASATRGWPLVARGAYRELLDAQWDMGSLPSNAQELRLIVTIGGDGRRRNARLENHRIKAQRLVEQQRAGAATTNAKLGRGD